jgi:hypothetical protein
LVFFNDFHEILVKILLFFFLFCLHCVEQFLLFFLQLFLWHAFSSGLFRELTHLLLLRGDLLCVEHTWRRQNIADFLHMISSTFLVVKSSPHVDRRIFIQVELRQIAVVAELFAIMLEVIIREEAGVDMLSQEFSQLDDEFILNHFELNFSFIQINNLDVNQLLLIKFNCLKFTISNWCFNCSLFGFSFFNFF